MTKHFIPVAWGGGAVDPISINPYERGILL